MKKKSKIRASLRDKIPATLGLELLDVKEFLRLFFFEHVSSNLLILLGI
jgi:hypothetical protein